MKFVFEVNVAVSLFPFPFQMNTAAIKSQTYKLHNSKFVKTRGIFFNNSTANCSNVTNEPKKSLPIKAERYESFTCAPQLDERTNGPKPNYTEYT